MMIDYEIYFDGGFLTKIYAQPQSENEAASFFFANYVTKLKHTTVIINFETSKEVQKIEPLATFINALSETVEPKCILNDNIEEWVKGFAKLGGLKIFFVELDPQIAEKFAKDYGYLFISSASLHKFFKSNNLLTTDSITYYFKDLQGDSSSVLQNWGKLNFISELPGNSIVIIDRFILADSDTFPVSTNLLPFLKNILPRKYIGTLNILFVFRANKKRNPNELNVFLTTLRDEITKIKPVHCNINVTFVNDIPGHKGIDFHDRYVITNYYTIYAGKGFNLFNQHHRLHPSNSHIDIKFHYHSPTQKKYATINQLNLVYNYINILKSPHRNYQEFTLNPETPECKLLKLT